MLKMNDVWVGRYLDMLCVHRAHAHVHVGSSNETEMSNETHQSQEKSFWVKNYL